MGPRASAGIRACAAAHVLLLLASSLATGEAKRPSGLLAEGTKWETPYHVNDSGVEGPALLITGGVHGNEPAGYRAAAQVRHWPLVRGRLVVVPRANVPGLEANTRNLPGEPEDRSNLNRNFPGPNAEINDTRGTIARALWRFIRDEKPDWVLDLHEGYAFRTSHKPPKGKKKSTGSSLIYRRGMARGVLDPIARRMQDAVNATVDDPDRRFVLLRGGPVSTGLVGASNRHLGIPGMILETTFKGQPVSLRTRQHRTMVNVFMREIGMIDRDCVDVMTPGALSAPGGATCVALYDGAGTGQSRDEVAAIVDAAPDMVLHHLGPADMTRTVLRRFHVVVFPGGGGSKQAAAIGSGGARSVREFVKEGGGYLGVCGGAFLASAHYSWSLELIDTSVLTGAREVEGKGKKQMWYRGKASKVKMQLTAEGRRLFEGIPERVEVKFQNGPIVSPKRRAGLPPYTVLAYFRSEKVLYEPQRGTMVDTPAIVSGRFHRGRVMSISPHPESAEALHPMITASIRWVAWSPETRDRPERPTVPGAAPGEGLPEGRRTPEASKAAH